MIKFILEKYTRNHQGIFSANFKVKSQKNEIDLRRKIASKNYYNYFNEISRHHSIEVMNKEVKIFLSKQKKNSIILDVGSGWCWHWKILNELRPDIKIVALDFVKENFSHAKKILGKKNLNQIYLVHDDFNNNKFPINSFDAVWSCQAFQHMDNLSKKFRIVHSLLKKSGYFYNYNLNYSLFVFIRNLFRKKKNQEIKKFYFLNRDINFQTKKLNKIFKENCQLWYNEILFHPELNLYFGNRNTLISKLDSKLSGNKIFKYFARQVLMKVQKC